MKSGELERFLADVEARRNPAVTFWRREVGGASLAAAVKKRGGRSPGRMKWASGKLTLDVRGRIVKRRGKADKDDGVIATFDAVITSARKDRDGDVLEPQGALIDQALPLLWQHNPDEPIGKLLKVLRQDDDAVECRFALADVPLGRRAARLIDFGALRLSIGFNALEYEPLDSGDEGERGRRAGGSGWRVTKYEIMEVSLVSIPSNVDAVVTGTGGKGRR